MKETMLQINALFKVQFRCKKYKKILFIIFIISILFIPNKDGFTIGLTINGSYRGIFNSAWIGIYLCIIYLTLISILGFFLIKDRNLIINNHRVNIIFESTSMNKSTFVLSLFFSKFLILLTTILPITIVGIIAQLVKMEVKYINLIDLISPFLVFAIPLLIFISSISCFFDCNSSLKDTFGNILFVFCWFLIFPLEMYNSYISPLGISNILNQISEQFLQQNHEGYFGYTVIGNGHALDKFLFTGTNYSLDLILGRIILIILSLIILKYTINSFNFNIETCLANKISSFGFEDKEKIEKNFLPKINNIFFMELLPFIKNVTAPKIITLSIVIIFSLFINARLFNALLFILPIDILSKLIINSKVSLINELIKSTNYYKKQILICFLDCFLILVIINIFNICKCIILGKFFAFLIIIIGCMFIASLATFLGELTQNENIFQFIYLVIIYLMIDGSIYIFDFTGSSYYLWKISNIYIYFIVSLVFIGISYLNRKDVDYED